MIRFLRRAPCPSPECAGPVGSKAIWSREATLDGDVWECRNCHCRVPVRKRVTARQRKVQATMEALLDGTFWESDWKI